MIPWDLFAWVQDVTPGQLPNPPVSLGSGVTLLNPAKWLTKLKEDCTMSKRPRAVFGALQHDLRRLYEIVEGI